MDEVWTRIDEELTARGRSWHWLIVRLGYERQRVHNWKLRGSVPTKEYGPIAIAMGESIDWVAGLAPPRRKDPEKLSPMALRLAQEFDSIEDPAKQLDAFAAVIAAITRARGT